MKLNKQISLLGLAVLMVVIGGAYSCPMNAQEASKSFAGRNNGNGPLWSVQVDKVDPGDVNLSPSFQIAIYESLLNELSKTKQFKQVVRDGDRNAADIPDLLILKTTVQKYTAGSETTRAVTTIAGATKLTVRSRLCTRDGRTILERTVDGNVRFIGNNLKATRNLAHNVSKTITRTSLPALPQSASEQVGQSSASSTSPTR